MMQLTHCLLSLSVALYFAWIKHFLVRFRKRFFFGLNILLHNNPECWKTMLHGVLKCDAKGPVWASIWEILGKRPISLLLQQLSDWFVMRMLCNFIQQWHFQNEISYYCFPIPLFKKRCFYALFLYDQF